MVRPELSEEEAARGFVLDLVVAASSHWPVVTEGWRPWVRGNVDAVDSPWTLHEFVLVSAAAQLRELTALIPDLEQIVRIRTHVLSFLSTPDLELSAVDGVEEYDRAWTAAVAQAQPPYAHLARTLFERVGRRLPPGAMDAGYGNPEFLLVVGQSVANFGGRYWKGIAQRHRLVS
jgi:hypothetical protein